MNNEEKNQSKDSWHSCILADSDLQKIKETVHKAELKTSGEIVPIIVKSSSVDRHVFWSLWLTWIAVTFGGHLILQDFLFNHQFEKYFWVVEILGILPVWFLARLHFVQRIFTDNIDHAIQVYNRAELEFYRNGLFKTKHQTGILIFISYLERQCVVLADKGIAGKLPPETWQGVVAIIIKSIKDKNLGQGLVAAIEKCGDHLAEHFPIQPGDKNELSDNIIIKE